MSMHEPNTPNEVPIEITDVPTAAEPTVESLQSEIALYQDQLKRAMADYQNALRNHRKEMLELRMRAAEDTITHMLPVLDDLHNALDSSTTATEVDSLRTGIELVAAKAFKIFEERGLRQIEVKPGQPFNVDLHEAVMHSPSDLPEGHVLQEVQRGYQLHDKIIRHSRVITSAGPSSANH